MRSAPVVLACDLDGVIADLRGGLRALAHTLAPAETTGAADPTAQTPQAWLRSCGYTDATITAVWAKVRDPATRFWASLPRLPDAPVAPLVALATVTTVYLLTDRDGPTAQPQTLDWVLQHVGRAVSVVVTPHKARAARALGITHALDDAPAMVRAYRQAGIDAVLVRQPWNASSEGDLPVTDPNTWLSDLFTHFGFRAIPNVMAPTGSPFA